MDFDGIEYNPADGGAGCIIPDKLTFTEDALTAIANQAIDRKTGARGLRAILETAMLDIMYEIPSEPDIVEVVVSEEVVTRGERPRVVYQGETVKEAS